MKHISCFGIALGIALSACAGSTSTSTSTTEVSRETFVPACNARPAPDSGACPYAGKCDAIYTCVDALMDPRYRGAVLRCQASACTPDATECLEKVALTVDDRAALSWAATCRERARAAKIEVDACSHGGALWSSAFRQEFDRCLTLPTADARLCMAALGGPCSKTYL